MLNRWVAHDRVLHETLGQGTIARPLEYKHGRDAWYVRFDNSAHGEITVVDQCELVRIGYKK